MAKRKAQKKSKITSVKRKLSPLDEVAKHAPARGSLTKKQQAEVLKLLGNYKDVDDQLDVVNSRMSSLLSEREKLAHQIVKRWGKGLLNYKGIHYMPASNHGKIVLRRLPDVAELG